MPRTSAPALVLDSLGRGGDERRGGGILDRRGCLVGAVVVVDDCGGVETTTETYRLMPVCLFVQIFGRRWWGTMPFVCRVEQECGGRGRADRRMRRRGEGKWVVVEIKSMIKICKNRIKLIYFTCHQEKYLPVILALIPDSESRRREGGSDADAAGELDSGEVVDNGVGTANGGLTDPP